MHCSNFSAIIVMLTAKIRALQMNCKGKRTVAHIRTYPVHYMTMTERTSPENVTSRLCNSFFYSKSFGSQTKLLKN